MVRPPVKISLGVPQGLLFLFIVLFGWSLRIHRLWRACRRGMALKTLSTLAQQLGFLLLQLREPLVDLVVFTAGDLQYSKRNKQNPIRALCNLGFLELFGYSSYRCMHCRVIIEKVQRPGPAMESRPRSMPIDRTVVVKTNVPPNSSAASAQLPKPGDNLRV